MAGRIPDSFLDELVARSDIVEVIGARVPLKKSGREYKACCPFHNEKTPSFWVSPDKQFYHCFGCGAHGTVIGFLMQYEKLEFFDAVADLAQRAGLDLPHDTAAPRDPGSVDLHGLLAKAAGFFQQNLADNARARRYLEARGIESKTAVEFALGYAPDAWDALLVRFGSHADERERLLQVGLVIERAPGSERGAGHYDRFRDRLMFPIRDSRGRTMGFGGRVLEQGEPKYLNSPETPVFHKGRELYGLYEAKAARTDFKRLLIVEGYMDVVRLHQAGLRYAIAALGTSITQQQIGKALKLTSELVFCFDGDRAGRQAARRALDTCLELACDGREFKFMFLPEGHDPDSLVATEGAANFESRSTAALPLSEYLVQQLLAEVDLQHDEGRAKLKALAAPLFERMPEGLYRSLLAERLATAAGMPAAVLRTYFVPNSSAPRIRAQPAGDHRYEPTRHRLPLSGTSAGRGGILTQAITLVLHHPAAAKGINAGGLAGLDQPGIPVLRELLETAAALQTPSTAMLLERWRGRHEHGRLCKLAMAAAFVADGTGAVQELRMAVDKLAEEHGPGRRMNELLRKAENLGLNSHEKAELSLLLQGKGRSPAPR